jgi:hypothetical protein
MDRGPEGGLQGYVFARFRSAATFSLLILSENGAPDSISRAFLSKIAVDLPAPSSDLDGAFCVDKAR